jgi:hypothetical protein
MKRSSLVGWLVGLVIVAAIAPTIAGGVAGASGMMGSAGRLMGSGGMMGSQGAMGGPGMMATPGPMGTPGMMATPGALANPRMLQGAAAQGMGGSGWALGFAVGLAAIGQLAFWGALLMGLALLLDWLRGGWAGQPC